MSGEYDDLWSSNIGRTTWLTRATREQREWLEGLAEEIRQCGREPVWSHVGERFRTKFEMGDHPVTSTLRDTVRRLVDG